LGGFLRSGDMPISISVNEYLFMSYVGLVASGYELTDKNDTEIMGLVDEIKNTSFKDNAIEYFKKARSTNEINPYWPYGSDISATSFFIKDYEFNTFDDYVAFIKSCGFGGHEDWFWDWIKELPNVLRQIQGSPAYLRLWGKYQSIIQNRIKDYNRQVKVIENVINKFTVMPYNIEFSPNLLQLPGMADFVKQGDRTIVITTYPTEIAILHEFLHPFISAHRNIISALLPIANLDKCINTESMITYGYMWDNSEDSKIHALEECFVRGISIGISSMSKQEKTQYCKWSCDSGFLFVREILKVMETMDITEDNLGDFMRQVMESGCMK